MYVMPARGFMLGSCVNSDIYVWDHREVGAKFWLLRVKPTDFLVFAGFFPSCLWPFSGQFERLFWWREDFAVFVSSRKWGNWRRRKALSLRRLSRWDRQSDRAPLCYPRVRGRAWCTGRWKANTESVSGLASLSVCTCRRPRRPSQNTRWKTRWRVKSVLCLWLTHRRRWLQEGGRNREGTAVDESHPM